MRRRVRAAVSLFSFLFFPGAQATAGSHRSQGGYLGWAERSLKCQGQGSDGDPAVGVLSVSYRLWVDRSVLVRFDLTHQAG